ncbi:hypothetical protein BOQ60_26330, partial [Chryseobacterium sp. CH1]
MNNGKWSPYLDVLVGQTYYLVIDNFSPGDTGLDLALAPPAVFPTNPPGTTASMNNGKWSPYLDVLVGQTYYLVIDNFS